LDKQFTELMIIAESFKLRIHARGLLMKKKSRL